MRIVITGGGTGGHIYPAIAVAQELKKNWDNPEITFLGTSKGIEAQAVPAAGFDIIFIPAAPMLKSPVKMLKFIACNGVGFMKSLFFLMGKKPGLVIGSGGFVSAPVILAASALGIPVVLMEQNVLPGKTNRLLSRFARKVLTGFQGSVDYFSPGKAAHTGNPIRPDIVERTREEAVSRLGISPDKFTLLITGASQGAKSINEAVIKALPAWKDKGWQIIHLVGKKNYDEMREKTAPLTENFNGEYRCLDYTEDMATLYAAADLVAARAGASTMAEITARGIPAVLIPYPYAADNHQEKNARWLEKCGGAVVIIDSEVEENLGEEVIKLAENQEKLSVMSEKCLRQGQPEARENILKEMKEFKA